MRSEEGTAARVPARTAARVMEDDDSGDGERMTLWLTRARAMDDNDGGDSERTAPPLTWAQARAMDDDDIGDGGRTPARLTLASAPAVGLSSPGHATPWTMTMDADKDGRCRRRTDAGAGGGGLTAAAPDGEDDGATDGRNGVARNEGNSRSDGVF